MGAVMNPTTTTTNNNNNTTVVYKIKKVYFCYYILAIIGLILICAYNNITKSSYVVHSVGKELIVLNEIEKMLQLIQGDDNRIMRWDVTNYTKYQQQYACKYLKMQIAYDILLRIETLSEEVRGRAAEYLTFCITDHQSNRVLFSQQDDIHNAVIELAKATPNPTDIQGIGSFSAEILSAFYASAMACHLIYITSFNNKKNYVTYHQEGAVQVLSSIIKDNKHKTPIQIMWACAALQNLVATYCQTIDGRCIWDWTEDEDELIIIDSSLPITIDGHTIRQSIYQNDIELIDQLVTLACSIGPSTRHPYPGDSARSHRDELSRNIIPWAATGALKNIILLLDARNYILQQYPDILQCFCQLSHSHDWLEQNKAEGILYMIRRSDPCWFMNPKIEFLEEGATSKTPVCIDHTYYTKDMRTCNDLTETPSEIDCIQPDRYNVVAKDACCVCGGGQRYFHTGDESDTTTNNDNNNNNNDSISTLVESTDNIPSEQLLVNP